LYLDIYTPNASLSLPVLFYIHGGGFQADTAIRYPSDILALQGVVVVVIQYRLGAFGFLTTGDSASPGNFGMLDQVQALKWVKENIESFGGNPNKVTIFGESAGGISVGLHLMSPLSKGLFHQAIADSGVDLCLSAIQPISYGLRYAKDLAQTLHCNTSNHKEMVACFREKKGTDIQKAANAMVTKFRFIDHMQWAPVVDKNFLNDMPINLRKKGHFSKVPLIVSFNSHEGSMLLEIIAGTSLGLNESLDKGASPTFFKSFLTKFAHARNNRKENADLIANALELMYIPWPDNKDKYALRSQLVDLVGDYLFVAPSLQTADMHSQFAPVYVYEFAHRSKLSPLPEWKGVTHGDNIVYDFGIPMLPGIPLNYDAADRNISLLIMEMYVNFARSGEPKVSGITWEKYNSTQRAYLRIDANPKMAASFNPRRMAFWTNFYPKLAQITPIKKTKPVTKMPVTKMPITIPKTTSVSGANTAVIIGSLIQILVIILVILL